MEFLAALSILTISYFILNPGLTENVSIQYECVLRTLHVMAASEATHRWCKLQNNVISTIYNIILINNNTRNILLLLPSSS